MKYLIIHLSDIHVKETESQNPILSQAKRIAEAALTCLIKPNAIFIVVTGDTAYSGKPKEYQIAEYFFLDIKEIISAKVNCPIYFVFVPGNHDCDFSLSDSARDIILSNISADKIDDSIVNQSIKVQNNYFDFLHRILDGKDYQINEKMFSIVRFEIDSTIVEFNLINSAWMSSIKEIQGKILFPIQYIHPYQDNNKQSSVSITMFHHPQPWYESSNGRVLTTEIEKISDIILTGHVHDDGFYNKTDGHGSHTDYLEGDVLQETNSMTQSGFNILVIDLEAKQQEIIHFGWDEQGYYKQISDPIHSGFLRNINRLKNEFTLQEKHEDYLHDPGAQYSHPIKDTIRLDDIFIYPNIKLIPLLGNGKPEIIQGPVQDFFLENDYISVTGQEKCGKTSLSKMLFLEFRSKGIVPLLVNGIEIKGCDEKSIVALIEKTYSEEYKTPDKDQYKQLSSEFKALIIDDFDKTKLNPKGWRKFLDTIKLLYKHVIIIGGDDIRVRDLLNLGNGYSNIFDFIECNILEFGYSHRSELIEKWYSLGQDYYVDERELDKKAINAERIITTLLGKNFIPSYPIFILVLLQQQEIQSPINLSTTAGSYGFLYESLLTAALLRSSKLNMGLDTQYSYLSELAYHFFSNRKKKINVSDVIEWHKKYCNDFSIYIDASEIQSYFINASILVRENDSLSFRYSYLYYYFVGRYFRDHISEDNVKAHILRMSKKLYHIESANILMFLCYLSKDPYILTTVISTSRDIFSTIPEFNIIDDTTFLCQAVIEMPKVILKANDPKENRKALLQRKDKIVAGEHPFDYQDDEDETQDDAALNKALQINAALKTVQIIGQILRNFHGSLKGPQKLELTQECYSLGLRVLKFVFSLIENNLSELVDTISVTIQSLKPKLKPEEIQTEARKVVFLLMEAITFSIIRYVSDSIGHDKLSITFDELINRNGNNISYRFIDISVRLDYFFNNFPEAKVLELNKEIMNKLFPRDLLKRLVWYHFYLYPSDYRLRASVCKKLGIELQLPKIFDERTKLV